tara:strand:- start:5794 stop:6582 length:789 start_codon:yes stop_codon:yes gene_type:complete
MKLNYFKVDSFTNELFKGNPACVVPLSEWLEDGILLKIAQENAVSETAFFIRKNDEFHLRWFTPEIEIDLCGHATLATAHVIKTCLNYSQNIIFFKTKTGLLKVNIANNIYFMDFPSRVAIPSPIPEEIKLSLNIQPLEVYKARDYLLIYNTQIDIENITINRAYFDQINLDCGGVIVSSIGNSTDFVSRFFTPQASILEDPVTGSAHCTLIPYWSSKLRKDKMEAIQLSQRGGQIKCQNQNDRVIIGGHAMLFSSGEFYIP